MVILLVLLLAALALATWQIYDQGRDLDDALDVANRANDVAEQYLEILRAAGLVNSVTSCERTKGGAK